MAKQGSEKAFRVTVRDPDTGKSTTLTVYDETSMDDRRVACDVQLALNQAGYRTTDIRNKRHQRRR